MSQHFLRQLLRGASILGACLGLAACKDSARTAATTAADTTASDTTASDTTASDTTASDTTASDTTASDTTVAETTAAETTAADTTAADTTDVEVTPPSGEAVIERGNSPARTGLYVQPTLTKARAASMARDTAFDGTVDGHVYAQPLYAADGPEGHAVFIVATESNQVVALDATTGLPAWSVSLGPSAAHTGAGCGNVAPLGVTGTPYLDLASRTIYLAAVLGTSAGAGGTIKTFQAHALSLDDGSERAGWPVDLSAARSGDLSFDPVPQNERGALAFVGGRLYIPFGGHYGDCGDYHGWVVGVPAATPTALGAWATPSPRAGSWAPGGLASDGTNLFATTGNGDADDWQGQEAIIRLQAGPAFSGDAADYWSPKNFHALDVSDVDIGGTNPMLVDLPGATPAKLVFAMGKDGYVYGIDREHLGGVGDPPIKVHVVSGEIIQVPATVTTANGTFITLLGEGGNTGVSCPGEAGDLVTLRLAAGAPPTLATAWCAHNQGSGSPIVTTTDGHAEAIVWTFGAEDSNRLHAWDAETGAAIFEGGGDTDVATHVRHFASPIAVGGRVVVAGDSKLYVFAPQ